MITEARQELIDALAGTGYLTYAYPAENMSPPAIVLVPGEPYVTGTTIGNRYQVNLKVTLMVALIDNQASLINLENLIETFLDVIPSGVGYDAFTSPSKVAVGPSEVLATTINLQITTIKE